jgi:hypothetical protein
MKRRIRLIAASAIAAALVLGLSLYLHSWGGLVLVAVAGAGAAWYRVQVARGEAAEQFFGDMGEETRMTSFQAGSPSEMTPLEPGLPAQAPAPPSAH